MSNQPYTPDKGDLKKAWDWYRADQDKEAGITQNFRAYRFEFLRAWDGIEAEREANVLRKAALDCRDPEVYAWLHQKADQINPPHCDQIEVHDE